ncbi:MAG: molybdopterin-dependent oxidoreductase [Bacteroidota bacterium]|nr:molybdopterin-dependent oxidoreductase [Bacteroidota bacterium]MDE2957661.1 molybdopterin-dependent oxidoreductase [Bacteroidota bacterium]
MKRRTFLKASAVSGGGFLLGFSWLNSPSKASADPQDPVRINAFLRLDPDGKVTIYSPNPEIGQNVKTSMPMVVAEELDVDWNDVTVEQAPLDTSRFTRQLAGGSQSIRQGWHGLRNAGATARHMLIAAAAQILEVPASELTTRNGVVTHGPSNASRTYGELAAVAGTLPVPTEVALKDPSDFTIIGTPRRNVDGQAIVHGKPMYGIDVQREGMLIAMITHAPAFGMRLKSIDDTAARSMPGIVDVFVIDAEPAQSSWADVNAFPEKVVVVGRTTWEVLKAKRALILDWEAAAPAESTQNHEETLTALMESDSGVKGRRDGDPEAAFAAADQVVDRTYSAPFLAHNTLEPMNFFAHVTADRAELIGPVQTPEALRSTVAGVCNLPEEAVTIGLTRMGGGFGRRLYGHFGVEAALISQRLKAPVKLLYTREDDMTQGTYRPAYKIRYRAALDVQGNLTAFHARGAGVGANAQPFPAAFSGPGFPASGVDNYLAEGFSVDSSVSVGAWRAPVSNFVAGAEQSFIDEVAEIAGRDPVEFRLALLDRMVNAPVGEGISYEPERYAGVIKLVAEKCNWDTPQPGVHRGLSVFYSHNSYVAEVVEIEIDDGRPKLKKVWAAVDCGIVVNPLAARNQVEGAIIDGIGHAMYSAITLTDSSPDQSNFDAYRLIRMPEIPVAIETFFVDNGIDPTGLGEPALPPASAALANAYARATGHRLYRQPYNRDIEALRVRQPEG